jgi:RHH-type transcriptional regulator, rel operon repressor / antitoxin RelB
MRNAQTNVSVSFRTRKAQIHQLDTLAKQQHRDRTQLIEEAIDQYLALQHLHLARIDEGIKAADHGEFATEEQVQAEFARWRKS